MQEHIFRAYDIRGKVGSEFLVDQVYTLGRAIAYYCKSKDRTVKDVVVARDIRSSSPAIHKELVRALQDSGLHVIDIDECPTPVMYFSQHTLSVQAGFMITASHNPKEYNGLKLCLQKKAIAGEELSVLKRYFLQQRKYSTPVRGGYTYKPIIKEYAQYLAKLFPELQGEKIAAIFDTKNGAVTTVFPELIAAFGWQDVQVIQANNASGEADPSHAKNMMELSAEVAKTSGKIGVGFDGDGDRVGAVTESGRFVPGDRLLALWMQELANTETNFSVVCDVKSSSVLDEVGKNIGATVHRVACGHSHIKKAMREHKALVAGELSCHFMFADRYFGFDDGVYAALRLLSLLKKSDKSLDQLVSGLPRKESSCEYRISYPHEQQKNIFEAIKKQFSDGKLEEIDGIKVYQDGAWALVRVSNTQPVLSICFEGDTKESLQGIMQKFILVLQKYVSKQDLTPLMA